MECTQVRTRAFLNISSIGMLSDKQHENLESKYFAEDRIKKLFEEYPNELLGLKLRFSLDVNPKMNEHVLDRTLEIADKLEKRLVVHVTNPAMNIEKLALALRPGDIFCHMYQGKNQSILKEDGTVREGIIEARSKGVLFDACNGRSNFSTDVAIKAMTHKFIPDIISTDLTTSTLYKEPVISLPFVMSKYLALGMGLMEIIRRCTIVPAKLIGLNNGLGTIQKNGLADLAIIKIKNKKVTFTDIYKNVINGSKVIVPQVTIKDGEIVYRQTDF